MGNTTVLFQKHPCGNRPAGALVRWHPNEEKYCSAHYCLVVSNELFKNLKYDVSEGAFDPETGEPTEVLTNKYKRYIIDVERLIQQYPKSETGLVYTSDVSLIKEEVPIG